MVSVIYEKSMNPAYWIWRIISCRNCLLLNNTFDLWVLCENRTCLPYLSRGPAGRLHASPTKYLWDSAVTSPCTRGYPDLDLDSVTETSDTLLGAGNNLPIYYECEAVVKTVIGPSMP